MVVALPKIAIIVVAVFKYALQLNPCCNIIRNELALLVLQYNPQLY